MKSLEALAEKFENISKNIDNNIMKAQEKTAQQIWADVINLAPLKTGEYISSIEIEGPEKVDDKIKTFVGSGLTVGPTLSEGKRYNLGFLLEHGTRPHDIYPVNSNYLVFDINGKTIFTKHVFHPGTISQPHYAIAIQKNKKLFRNNIKLSWREK